MTPTNEAGHGLPEQWPDYVMLRDTKIHDDMGGLGQRIYTTAGAGYKKVKYVREDLALSRGVPADMVLVPREPTDEMVDAGRVAVMALDCCGPKWTVRKHYEASGADPAGIPDDLLDAICPMPKADRAELVYRAMLAAAPAAAGAQGEEYRRGYAQGVADTQKSPKYDSTGDTVYTQPAAADGGVGECSACKGAGEVMLPVWTHDPQDGYDAMGECPKCGGNGSAFPSALADLVHFTEHCLSAADEGEDYAVSREWLDAMTTMGIMKKNGRGKWAPTEQAQSVASALRALSSHRQAAEPVAEIVAVDPVSPFDHRRDWSPDRTIVWSPKLEGLGYLNLPVGTKLYTAPPPGADRSNDQVRMDWLCSMAVQVRTPLRYGSRELFHAQTDSDDGEDHHTTLREQIDAQLALVEKGAGNG